MAFDFLNPAADPTQLGNQVTPRVGAPLSPTANAQAAVPGLGGAPQAPPAAAPGAGSSGLGVPDLLIGLANFIAATKKPQPNTPAPQSFAGIGSPAPQGGVGQGRTGRTVSQPGSIGKYL